MNREMIPAELETETAQRYESISSQELLVQLFREIESELLGTLYHILGNTDDAQDAMQEAFLRCWKRIDSLTEIQNIKAWIFRIALNISFDFKKSAWQKKRQILAEENKIVAKGETPETVMAQKEELARLRQAITQLEDGEKEVFLLRKNGGFSFEQIAQMLEIPLGTAKTRMRRAVMKLHGLLLDASQS
ncbi:MAG: RNA polymerase sigma factor [Planctomycetaceae bacterium]|nr:RNA polymerase sigma factor [Planctomycetaceae bacterium]